METALPKFDVVAINLESHLVRFMAEDKTKRNAEAIESMAITRRGCDEDFYAIVPHGKYKDGERWSG